MKQVEKTNPIINNMHSSSFIRLFSFLGILCLLTLVPEQVLAQANGAKNQQFTMEEVVGTWKFDFKKSLSSLKSERKSKYESLDSTLKKVVKDGYQGRTYTFKLDGTFVLKLKNGTEVNGEWGLNPKGERLGLKFESGLRHNYNVVSSSRKRMKLKIRDSEQTTMLFKSMILVKR